MKSKKSLLSTFTCACSTNTKSYSSALGVPESFSGRAEPREEETATADKGVKFGQGKAEAGSRDVRIRESQRGREGNQAKKPSGQRR